MTDWMLLSADEHALQCAQLRVGDESASSEDAWHALLCRFSRPVQSQIRKSSHHLSKEDVEDVTQEVFFKLYRALPNYDGVGSFRGLLSSIVHSVLVDWQRAKRGEWDHIRILDDLDFVAERFSSEAVPLDTLLAAVMEKFAEMPTEMEQRVLQGLLNDQSIREICENLKHLGITEYRVKEIRKRAKQLLADVACR
jgi:RNA polymerase sigma factor (sigma-70 family)